MSFVLKEKKEYVLLLTLNRPEVMNALNLPTLLELQQALKEVWFAKEVRVIIVTGAGEKAFCAGADLKEREKMSELEVKNYIKTIRDTFTMFEDIPKPVICAINGYAFGGGLEMALACDLRIAAETAKMGLTETSLAIIPGAGGTQRLPRIVGKAKAKELIFTARRIDAQEAYRIGLVNEVVPKERLLDRAFKIANEIAQNGPLAVEAAKFAINKGSEVDIKTGLEIESKTYDTLIPTRDRREGLLAFKEKRKPQYMGE
ncbi:enoyl-CoA hydratase/isomerase [Thermosulfidibacter takaii ABI70S6]|uniref:Enoyl-CoA hydratase/isomerase n=1 Tax=Thermosulfidibacter takaii (strain DSM 17441 / JCM 13301 / NBRC 103674 / ABI70S6) TaxID=1298851 RepID=A0A0S3QVL5_THET7|nr:enoyl-CoA hydratase [Thermosulfidibacter takaii]BAT72367.1 enoyl-CoA hydratase/isomerase [Thermosulfidibacter takaii ABI70S6]